eukprot:5295180-Prymnesium_polylepis.1
MSLARTPDPPTSLTSHPPHPHRTHTRSHPGAREVDQLMHPRTTTDRPPRPTQVHSNPAHPHLGRRQRSVSKANHSRGVVEAHLRASG